MKVKNFPCKISANLMIHFLFAVICQLTFTVLFMTVHTESAALLPFPFAEYMQSALASIALTLGGAYLIDKAMLELES